MDVCVRHFQAQNNRCYPIATAKCLDFLCNLLGEEDQALQCLVVEVVEVVDLFLGNNECVALCEGVDIQKCVLMVVFGHFIAWDLASYNS